MSNATRKLGTILPLTLAVFLGFWLLGKRAASAPQDNQIQWTAQSHDRTHFPLTGKHKMVACRECHLKGVFEGTPRTCEACHWERKRDDRYGGRLGIQCADCHTPEAWKDVKPDRWNHQAVSGFKLEGGHRILDCAECHGESGFRKTAVECFACHAKDFRSVQDPNHVTANFPTQCQVCHPSGATWKGAKYDHRFPLHGQHLLTSCSDCHKNGQYAGLSSACVSCHLNDYDKTNDPSHKQAGYSTDCGACHGDGAQSWKGAIASHNKFTLKGNHRLAACTDCHKNGQYAGTLSSCVSCHLTDYNGTTDPNHKLAGYSTDCTTCHGDGAQSWKGAIAGHNKFALKGKHALAACADCHKNGQYAGTPSTCVSCHLTDYNNAADPSHKLGGYSTDCATCHGDGANNWNEATVNHSQYWPLQGAHLHLSCNACHSQGYNLPKDCYGCHATNYNNTTNPNHKSSGYSTTCENCHFPTHTSWSQAVFNHRFPITSGRHSGFACTDCHLASNYNQFSCIDCHTHNKSSMDSEHKGISGYSYNSPACYSCHPTGRG